MVQILTNVFCICIASLVENGSSVFGLPTDFQYFNDVMNPSIGQIYMDTVACGEYLF